MTTWIQKVLNIDVLLTRLKVLDAQYQLLQEKNNALKKEIEQNQKECVRGLQMILDETRKMNAKIDVSTQSEHEENSIEKDKLPDEIDVSEGEHIPLVDGMKVKFEGSEGVDTVIHLQ